MSGLMARAQSKPYGDVTYADNGMQPDGKARYPLDSEPHCRAAWSYINQADNAAKYTPKQLKLIKARIRAAGRKYGITFAEDVKAAAAPMTGIELARPGSWQLSSGKRTFTAEDLKDAADFFRESGQQRVPLGFGHQDSRFDGEPAYGWLANVRYTEDAKGPVLLGDLVDMDEWLAAAAPTRWPNRSIEGFANLEWNGRTYRLALTRLALLGDTPPAMPTLRSLADLREAIAAAAATSGAEPIAASAIPLDPAPSEAVVTQHQDKEAGMDPAKIRERLGLDDDVSDDEIMEALGYAGFVPAADEATEPDATPVAAAALAAPAARKPGTIQIDASAWNEREERIKRLEAQETRRRGEERDQIITEAVRDGKFAPARRGHWQNLWDADPEGTREAIAGLAKGLLPIAAAGYTGASDEDLDAEFAHLFPPTGQESRRG